MKTTVILIEIHYVFTFIFQLRAYIYGLLIMVIAGHGENLNLDG